MDLKLYKDEQLMSATAKGEMAAFGELVSRHQEKVFFLALRTVGNWDMAEDISQEVFIRVYHAAKRYRVKSKFTTWLYRIVVNLCLDHKRKIKHAYTSLSDQTKLLESSAKDNPEVILQVKENKKSVWQALEELSKRERMVIILHRFNGLSHAEIAETTGWSVSSVESLMVRSYRKLRKELEKLKYFEK